jgi:TPR repeat protein
MRKPAPLLFALWLVLALPLQAEPQVDIVSLQQSAQAGDAYAQLNLGAAYDNGIGVARDIEQALFWYQKAAEQGIAEAQFNLAHLLVAEELSASTAAEWMRKAAEQGMVDAEYLMGVIYTEGIGVAVNHNEARRWLNKAVARGHADAKLLLKQLGQRP